MKKHKSYIKYEDIVDKQSTSINMQQSSFLNIEIKPLKQSVTYIPTIDRKTPFLQSRKNARNSLPLLRSPLQSQLKDRIDANAYKEGDKLRMEYEHLKALYDKQESVLQVVLVENTQMKNDIKQLKTQIEDLKINIKRFQIDDETAFQRSKLLANQHDQIVKEMQWKINSLLDKTKNSEQAQLRLPNNIFLGEFQSLCLDLKSQLECKFCGKELHEPVTLIPCAHSYCKACKKGYQNNCFMCGKDEKIEAAYLNQFLIDMMALYKRNIGLIELMKNNL